MRDLDTWIQGSVHHQKEAFDARMRADITTERVVVLVFHC